MKIFVFVLLGIIFLAMVIGVVFLGCVLQGIPIYPFTIQRGAGGAERGVITNIQKKDWYDHVVALPGCVGMYILTIQTDVGEIYRCVQVSKLDAVPKVGDKVQGTLYLVKTHFDNDWRTWQPFIDYRFPDFSLAWTDARILR